MFTFNWIKSLKYFIILLILMLFSQAFATFSVVSTSPTHGTAGVDTAETFSITFSAPIDISARFPFPQDFFINILLWPDSLVGEPDSITLSQDMQTVYVHNLHLQENTTYFFIIVNAVSITGDSLDKPHAILFSTKPTLPTGQVQGTISYPGDDPTGALVVLFDQNPIKEEADGSYVSGAIIQNTSGNYVVDYLEPGTYWPAAVKNFYISDKDGEIKFKSESALGFFDPDGDHVLDSIVVNDGGQVTNVNITINPITPQTARDVYPTVESAAKNWASDAYLASIYGDIRPDGQSDFWQFHFISPSLAKSQFWFVFGQTIISPGENDFYEPLPPVPDNWLDSDTVMSIAEENGGSEFRNNHPDAELYGMLGLPDFFYNSDEDRSVNTNESFSVNKELNKIYPQKKNKSFFPIFESTSSLSTLPNLPIVWFVNYYSEESWDNLNFFIDPVTGEILSNPTTAKTLEAQADTLAKNWADDYRLCEIASSWPQIEIDGTANWSFKYYSPAKDEFYQIDFLGKIPIYEGPAYSTPMNDLAIPDGWLDSDVCMAAAEAAGGATFRATYDSVFVYATLNQWYMDPSKTVWTFYYVVNDVPPLIITIDAMTGTQPTNIAEEKNAQIPGKYILKPNYPNPFNPSTQIEYALPKSSKVELAIYSLLGQKVETLVQKKQPAGTYKLVWKPQGLASGTYLLVLKANNATIVRKIQLIK